MIRKLPAISVFILFLCCHLWGLDPEKSMRQYLVDHWKRGGGLPSDTINNIVQTPDGYLWIATRKGLVRFDGIKFTGFDFIKGKETDSRENPIPDALLVDREGTLRIGGPRCLTAYRLRTGRFETYPTPDRIRCIKEDMKGNLWLGFWSSYAGRFSGGRFTPFNDSHGLWGKKINGIVENSKGDLLFGSREKGLFTFKEGRFAPFPVPGLDDVYIIFLYEDGNGNLWIGTSNGLFRVNRKGTQRYGRRDGLSDGYITRLLEDSDRNLWVGTLKGLNRLKRKPDGTAAFESLLESFIITCLFEDREGSLWVGTYNSGVKRIKDGKFISYAPLEAYQEEIFQSVFQDSRGDTWIGTLGGKLFRCRGGRFLEAVDLPELSGTAISSIAEAGRGNLWLGTNGKGVFKKNLEKHVDLPAVPLTTAHGLADNLVTSIYGDSRGNLWCCTFDGVSVIQHPGHAGAKKPAVRSINSRTGLSGKVAHNVYEDRDHHTWIAADKGITILRNGEMGKRNTAYLLPGLSVTCIYEDPSPSRSGKRVFWAATHGAGLRRLEGRIETGATVFSAHVAEAFTVTAFTTAGGMTTNFIYCFFEGPGENFWLMSDSGILRVNKGELNRLAAGRDPDVRDIRCTAFGISDGMKSLEFNNEFSSSSALKTNNGEFWFITKKGISIVNPARVKLNKSPPPVIIEKVWFDRLPVPLHPAPGASPAVSRRGIEEFRFRFTAPTFLYPEKVKFQYRLEGFDPGWVAPEPGAGREARYANLGPGTYTFKVIAANSEGVWNRGGDSMTFTLIPFFYQTLLFKIALVLLLAVLAGAGFYLVKKQPFKNRKRYKGSPLEPGTAAECIKKLRYLMEIKKAYKDPDISLQSLAEQLSVSHHLLSQVLNEKLGQKFFDYIHQYRIEEAQKILREPGKEDQKIAAIAYEVGFNTVPGFYKAFKKFTHMTPTEYKKVVSSQ